MLLNIQQCSDNPHHEGWSSPKCQHCQGWETLVYNKLTWISLQNDEQKCQVTERHLQNNQIYIKTHSIKNSLAVHQKIKYGITLWLSTFTPKSISQRNENNSIKSLYTNIHSSTIHAPQRWKLHKCPLIGEWINKMWSIQWNITQV